MVDLNPGDPQAQGAGNPPADDQQQSGQSVFGWPSVSETPKAPVPETPVFGGNLLTNQAPSSVTPTSNLAGGFVAAEQASSDAWWLSFDDLWTPSGSATVPAPEIPTPVEPSKEKIENVIVPEVPSFEKFKPEEDIKKSEIKNEEIMKEVKVVSDEAKVMSDEVKEEFKVEKEEKKILGWGLEKKYSSLKDVVKKIYDLKKLETGDVLDIVWSDNDTIQLVYSFSLKWDDVLVSKKETLKWKEQTASLKFSYDKVKKSLMVYVGDYLLWDEEEDLKNDHKKKMQVIDKLNKFVFLLEEEMKKIEAKEEEKDEMKNVFKMF